MLERAQAPVQSEPEPEEWDYAPCPEDEEFFVRPDAAGMEEAIGKFLDGLEGQERRGFEEMHQFLSTLPVPTPQESKGMTHAEARARCYPFDMPTKRFHGFNPKVCSCSLSIEVCVCTY